MLAGSPGLPGHQHLFSAETYRDLTDTPYNPDRDDETYMKCTPISDTHIQNNTCVLAPEVTEGPYYHLEGHPLRQNIAELQDGLLFVCCARTLYGALHQTDPVVSPQLLDIGVIDVETCKPLPNVLVDIWHANATGVYAGCSLSCFVFVFRPTLLI